MSVSCSDLGSYTKFGSQIFLQFLISMLMSSSKLFLFSKEVHLNSGVRLLLELYCVVVNKRITFFTIWAKLIMPFTCTSLPLNLYTSVFICGCGFRFEQKFWWIDEFGEKKARIGRFAYLYSPPSFSNGLRLVHSFLIHFLFAATLDQKMQIKMQRHTYIYIGC